MIYIGTFLLNSNWNYRLIFLILTLPQLSSWSFWKGRLGLNVRLSIFGIFMASVTYPIGIFFKEKPALYLAIVITQVPYWLIFITLLYLFFLTMPQWLKDYIRRLLSLRPSKFQFIK